MSGPRSFGLITSMLSVFLSGGVLLTLDQNLPRHRRQLMIQETSASRLLYVGVRRPEDEWMWESLRPLAKRRSEQGRSITHVDADTGRAIAPGTDSERAASEDAHLKTIPLPELAPDEPAYIFFTSDK